MNQMKRRTPTTGVHETLARRHRDGTATIVTSRGALNDAIVPVSHVTREPPRRRVAMSTRAITSLKFLIATLALAPMIGCKMNLTTNLYTTDLRDAIAGTPGLTALAEIEIEVPSAANCAEYTPKFARVLDGILNEYTMRGCKNVAFNSFLLIETQLPFYTGPEQVQDTLFGVLLVRPEDSDHIGVSLVMDVQRYKILGAQVKEEFRETVDLASSQVKLVLHNDERKPIRFATRDTFVNKSPVHSKKEFEVSRRYNSTIQLSDVATSNLAREGTAVGFVLLSPNH